MEEQEKEINTLISTYEKMKKDIDKIMKTYVGFEKLGELTINSQSLEFKIKKYQKGVIYLFEKDKSFGLSLGFLNQDDFNKPFLINNVPTTLSHEIFKYYMKGFIDTDDLYFYFRGDFNPNVFIIRPPNEQIYPIDIILELPSSEIDIERLKVLLKINTSPIHLERIRDESLRETVKKLLRNKKIHIPKVEPFKNTDWLQNEYDYFSYGERYFDGNFNVIKFPKGMTIYHGSARFGDEAVSYPVGKGFYNQNIPGDIIENASESEYTIQELLSETVKIDPAWYTDIESAKKYSGDSEYPGCKNFCIHSYKLKRDCVFFLLDDEQNLIKLLEDPTIPPNIKQNIRGMFTIPDDYIVENSTIYTRDKKRKDRSSSRGDDKPVADWACDFLIGENYAGYCAPVQDNGFHLEFIVCNSFLYLERDLQNVNDMFYDAEEYPPLLKLLFEQMKMYETTNTNFHSGDLFQHSIWCLLFAEDLSNRTRPAIDERFRKVIIAASLLHDIGKMDPENCGKNIIRKKYIYNSLPEHPTIGADYFNNKGIPIVDSNLNIIDYLKPQQIITELIPDVTPEEMNIIENTVRFHWNLGHDVISKRGTPEYVESIREYIQLFNGSRPSIISTIITSISDIEATQPFTANKLKGLSTDEIKSLMRSKVFNFIVSKPKIYRGGNISTQLDLSKTNIDILNEIVKFI